MILAEIVLTWCETTVNKFWCKSNNKYLRKCYKISKVSVEILHCNIICDVTISYSMIKYIYQQAQIALRNIKSVADYPARMQRKIAEIGIYER